MNFPPEKTPSKEMSNNSLQSYLNSSILDIMSMQQWNP